MGEYTLKTALNLYSLDQYHVLWEPEMDTKCILGWSRDNLIVCAFRGTISLQNVRTDLQASSLCDAHCGHTLRQALWVSTGLTLRSASHWTWFWRNPGGKRTAGGTVIGLMMGCRQQEQEPSLGGAWKL